MLAGRKLLLADDSPTIQKVVELTFADEGVEVTSAGSGAEALEKLAEDKPDVVLADVYMPLPSGYEICKFIKENAELKHIPVMLLVGSFEPFDEVEARKVGADDILTKPFQSIRRLIDRVGGLVSGKQQDPDQVPTAELPHANEVEPERMSTDELELTTANTQPLPAGVSAEAFALKHPSADIPTGAFSESKSEFSTTNQMETSTLPNDATLDGSDVLLDLGEPSPAPAANAEDFVLDIDLEPAAVGIANNGARHSAFVEPQVSAPAAVDWQLETEPSDLMLNRTTGELAQHASTSQMEDTLEWKRGASESADAVSARSAPTLERVFDEPVAAATASIQSGNLTAEQIEVIARRAVELLSERVVQQIAWEVVPQLAELMIKRKLEEKETQTK